MNLRKGSEGPDVAQLQRQLNEHLPAGEKLTVDGDFGGKTDAAVRAFQKEHGLEADGVVGPKTRAALAKAHEKPAAPPKHAPAQEEAPKPKPAPSGPSSKPDLVSLHKLHEIMPHLTTAHGKLYVEPLNRAMHEFKINSRLREAAFLAQLAEESVELLYFHEIASGWEYDISRNPKKAKELGNLHVGDGPRYKGRGPIQLTGKYNYIKAGKELGLNLVGHPDLAATPNVGFRIAGWFWVSRGLNGLADARNFREITRRINGGYNGYSVRVSYYNRALNVL
jgi:putative chitinase